MSINNIYRQILKWIFACGLLAGLQINAMPTELGVDKNTRIIMLGDSITKAGNWETLLPGHTIINRGVPGYTTGDLLREVNETIALKPAKVFLMIGINDLLRAANVDQTFNTYSSVVEQLRKIGARIYIQSTIECARAQCGKTVDDVQELNQKLQVLAASFQLEYIDLNAGLTNAQEGLSQQNTNDGLHLSKSAYHYWSVKIKAHLQKTD